MASVPAVGYWHRSRRLRDSFARAIEERTTSQAVQAVQRDYHREPMLRIQHRHELDVLVRERLARLTVD